VIEPTDEMRKAIAAHLPMIRYPMYDADSIMNAIATDVLALVERDWNMQPNPAPESWRRRKPLADEHHYDTSCDDRPYCRIREHHALD
jgi:hypothetical protein